MNATHSRSVQAGSAAEHFDVLIVGAGISGIGGAYHLTQQCPSTRFVVLEAQASFEDRIVHPQTWPEDLNYAGKRVVVIGSGATAATIVRAARGATAVYTLAP